MPLTLTCDDHHCPDGPKAHLHTWEGGRIIGPAYPPPESEQPKFDDDLIERLAKEAFYAWCSGEVKSPPYSWEDAEPYIQRNWRLSARAVATAMLLRELSNASSTLGLSRPEKAKSSPPPLLDNPWEQVQTRQPNILSAISALKQGLAYVEVEAEVLLKQLEELQRATRK